MFSQNILQQTITWNMADLEIFQTMACFVATANNRFKDIQNLPGNLGAVANYETPPRFGVGDSLVANFQPIQQNARSIAVNQQASVAYAGTAEQIIFNNLDEYTLRLGDSAMQALATKVEIQVATLCETIPYRFYGNGVVPIASAEQLAQALANFRQYSAPPGTIKCYLDLAAVPGIVNAMQNQFTDKRNNENAMTWEVGNWAGVEFYQSTNLPVHYAGTIGQLFGQAGNSLTVVSTNDPTGNYITEITFSGAGTDANAIKAFDLFQFTAGSGNTPLPTFLQWQGYNNTGLPFQFAATANAASSGGNVTVSITPPICATPGNVNRNVPNNIIAGMTVGVLPTRKCGMLVSDNALYVAMPALPSQFPFPSSEATDPNTKVSVRLYYGNEVFNNTYGWARDCVYGYDAVPQNTMQLCFPLYVGTGIGM